MAHSFKFFKNRQNTEVIRVKVNDPQNPDKKVIVPSELSKVELVVGDVVISSTSGEISWVGDIISIKPSVDNVAVMTKQTFSELVIYTGSESKTISTGFTYVVG